MRVLRAAALILLLFTSVLTAVGCKGELRVVIRSIISADGGIQRHIEITSVTSSWSEGEEEEPEEPTLLTELIEIPGRSDWTVVRAQNFSLVLEGFFATAEQVPPPLVHVIEESSSPTDHEMLVDVVDAGLFTAYVISERFGDAVDAERARSDLRSLCDDIGRKVAAEASRQFGEGAGTARAGAALGDSLYADAMTLRDAFAGVRARDSSDISMQPVMERLQRAFGVEISDVDELFELINTRAVQSAASAAEPDVAAGDIVAWLSAQDLDQMIEEAVPEELASSALLAIFGFYGTDASPRILFDSSIELPGELYRTNGKPLGSSTRWLIRDDQLTSTEFVAEAVSVVWNAEAWRAIGANHFEVESRRDEVVEILLFSPEAELFRASILHAIEAGHLDGMFDDSDDAEDVDDVGRFFDLVGILVEAGAEPPSDTLFDLDK